MKFINKLRRYFFGASESELKTIQAMLDSMKTSAGKVDFAVELATAGRINQEQMMGLFMGRYRK